MTTDKTPPTTSGPGADAPDPGAPFRKYAIPSTDGELSFSYSTYDTFPELLRALDRDPEGELSNSPYFQGSRAGYSFFLVPAEAAPTPGVWVAVAGRDLPGVVQLRLVKRRGGQVAVTGMMLGEGGDDEITSETLRRLRVADILQALMERFSEGEPPGPDVVDGQAVGDGSLREAYWLFRDLVYNAAPDLPEASAAREDLKIFADTYRRLLQSQPRRAMTATAQELHISRATANRRADECRDLGLLEKKESAR